MDKNIKTFMCNCLDRDHIILGIWDGNRVSLRFVVVDYCRDIPYGGRLFNWIQRIKWKIKRTIQIWVDGFIQLDDEWIPLEREKEFVRGERELTDLIEWLLARIDQAKY